MAGASGYGSLPVITSGNRVDTGDIVSSTYNGLVVGSTMMSDSGIYDTLYREGSNFQSASVPGSQERGALISLVAPGRYVRLPQLGAQTYGFKEGSSVAAPQATGAVALLAQYAQVFVTPANNLQHWNSDSLKPEVMKAILMNSVDKVAGRLGMEKTIYDDGGFGWDTLTAADIPSTREDPAERAIENGFRQDTPTSNKLGTGQLNVRRRSDQYDGGEYHPVAAGNTLPTQAWDFNSLNQQNGEQIYRLPALAQGSYISMTLTWNRNVTLQERGEANGRYDQGETFQAAPISNLDLLLVDRTAANQPVVWRSNNTVQNVEHIFWQVQNNHEYNIVVKQINNQGASYSLAWWAQPLRQGAGMVQGTAWTDVNKNGVWGTGEDGREGVYVDLYNADHVWMGSTTTDSNGEYQFQNLDAGDYYVQFTQASGFHFTGQDVGTNDAIDSDADINGVTAEFTITSNEQITLDAGLEPLPTGSVSGRVWDDTDSDGIQDTGEDSREGVAVDLYDDSDNYIDSAVTDENGSYQINWLPAGDYYVKFAAPVNYGFTTQNAGGNDNLDSDADTDGLIATFTLATDQQITHVDAGLVVTASSVQGYLWDDADADGIQDSDESAISYAEVSLYDSSSNLVATTNADENGNYSFDLLSADDYYVAFTKPFGFADFSLLNEGTDTAVDNDADSSGETATFTLGSAEIKTHVDAGLIAVEYGSISGLVWQDTNSPGVQNTGESGVAGVFVDLFDADDAWAGSAITDSSGHYQFDGVAPGDYHVVFNPPTSSVFTLKDVGADDSVDSDAGTNGHTDVFTVGAGEGVVHVDAGFHVNIAPVNTKPSSQTTNPNTNLVFSSGNSNAISIADVDASTSTVQVTLTATQGALTLSGTSGLSFSFSDANGAGAGDGTTDTTMTFRGTISNINTALNGLTFVPTSSYHGNGSVQIVTNDLGNTGWAVR